MSLARACHIKSVEMPNIGRRAIIPVHYNPYRAEEGEGPRRTGRLARVVGTALIVLGLAFAIRNKQFASTAIDMSNETGQRIVVVYLVSAAMIVSGIGLRYIIGRRS